MRLNVSDIMAIEMALRDYIRNTDADIEMLSLKSTLREMLESDSAKAKQLYGIFKKALSAEVHIIEDSEVKS